jgi:hypothetical protein
MWMKETGSEGFERQPVEVQPRREFTGNSIVGDRRFVVELASGRTE